MQNIIKYDEPSNIMLTTYHGSQTAAVFEETVENAIEVIKKIRAQNRPVHMLIDASDVTTQDSGARTAAINAINSLDYDKMAIFSSSVFVKYLVTFLIMAAQKQDKIKYFDTEEQARTWLTST
jgi:hypothetical protein